MGSIASSAEEKTSGRAGCKTNFLLASMSRGISLGVWDPRILLRGLGEAWPQGHWAQGLPCHCCSLPRRDSLCPLLFT